MRFQVTVVVDVDVDAVADVLGVSTVEAFREVSRKLNDTDLTRPVGAADIMTQESVTVSLLDILPPGNVLPPRHGV